MKHQEHKKGFWKLLQSIFKISLLGFGGGSALIPVIEEEVVGKGLVTREEYDEDVMAACMTPGALPVEIVAGVGSRTYGAKGMLASAVMIALPGAVMVVLLLSALASSSAATLQIIRYLSIGLSAFIACMLMNYILKTHQEAKQESKKKSILTLLIIIGIFILTGEKNIISILGLEATPIFGLTTIQVLVLAFFIIFYNRLSLHPVRLVVTLIMSILYLSCAGRAEFIDEDLIHYLVYGTMIFLSLQGIIMSFKEDTKEEKHSASIPFQWKTLYHEVIPWVLFTVVLCTPILIYYKESIGYLISGFISSLMSFGGGDAYLTIADGLFINSEMISSSYFYGILVPVVNVLPGSILVKILTGIGYRFGFVSTGSPMGALLCALGGFAVGISASGMIFILVRWLMKSFKNITIVRAIGAYIRPIISGLLLSVVLTMIKTNINTGLALGEPSSITLLITVILIMVGMFMIHLKKSSHLSVMLSSTILGASMMGITLLF